MKYEGKSMVGIAEVYKSESCYNILCYRKNFLQQSSDILQNLHI